MTDRLTGKIIGYRGWTLDGYKLGSANREQHGGFWNIGPNRAECRIAARREYIGHAEGIVDRAPAEHAAPHPDCECGLYAYFDVRRENNPHYFPAGSLIWGAVAAWGHVEVHSSGFRAEYAEPVALAYSPRDPYEDVVKHQAIAGELGLPFVPFDRLEAEALKHGQLVPEEMRPAVAPRFAPGGLVPSPGWSFYAGEPSGVSFREMAQSMHESMVRWESSMVKVQTSAYGTREAMEALLGYYSSVAPESAPIAKPKRIFGKSKGVAATLKTSGPPFQGKWRKDDLVKDRRGNYWICTASGQPGSWEAA